MSYKAKQYRTPRDRELADAHAEVRRLKNALLNAQSHAKMADDRRDMALVLNQNLIRTLDQQTRTVPMLMWCPMCLTRHIDDGEFATKPHHTHACQNPACGMVWRPAKVNTIGVKTLPGFLNEASRVAATPPAPEVASGNVSVTEDGSRVAQHPGIDSDTPKPALKR